MLVERAKGALMHHYGIDSYQAFAVLIAWARTSRTPVAAVATTRGFQVLTGYGVRTEVMGGLEYALGRLLAFVFIAGGFLGSYFGSRAARRLSGAGHLTTVFAALIFVVAAYMLWKSGSSIGL